MSDIAPLGRFGSSPLDPTGPLQRYTASKPQNGQSKPTGRLSGDRVDFSASAQMLSKLTAQPDVRQNLVDQVRTQIANGSYETPEKLDAALDAMFKEL